MLSSRQNGRRGSIANADIGLLVYGARCVLPVTSQRPQSTVRVRDVMRAGRRKRKRDASPAPSAAADRSTVKYRSNRLAVLVRPVRVIYGTHPVDATYLPSSFHLLQVRFWIFIFFITYIIIVNTVDRPRHRS